MTRHTLLRLLSITLLLGTLGSANAVEMRHNFTLTGNNGETGTGFFTWDDAVVPDGNALPLADMLSASVTINGGTTPGGTQTFVLADWTGGVYNLTPDFLLDINIIANNGVASLSPFNPFMALTSWGSIITYVPGATVPVAPAAAQSIPLLNTPGLILIYLLVALIGLRQIKRFQSGKTG